MSDDRLEYRLICATITALPGAFRPPSRRKTYLKPAHEGAWAGGGGLKQSPDSGLTQASAPDHGDGLVMPCRRQAVIMSHLLRARSPRSWIAMGQIAAHLQEMLILRTPSSLAFRDLLSQPCWSPARRAKRRPRLPMNL